MVGLLPRRTEAPLGCMQPERQADPCPDQTASCSPPTLQLLARPLHHSPYLLDVGGGRCSASPLAPLAALRAEWQVVRRQSVAEEDSARGSSGTGGTSLGSGCADVCTQQRPCPAQLCSSMNPSSVVQFNEAAAAPAHRKSGGSSVGGESRSSTSPSSSAPPGVCPSCPAAAKAWSGSPAASPAAAPRKGVKGVRLWEGRGGERGLMKICTIGPLDHYCILRQPECYACCRCHCMCKGTVCAAGPCHIAKQLAVIQLLPCEIQAAHRSCCLASARNWAECAGQATCRQANEVGPVRSDSSGAVLARTQEAW